MKAFDQYQDAFEFNLSIETGIGGLPSGAEAPEAAAAAPVRAAFGLAHAFGQDFGGDWTDVAPVRGHGHFSDAGTGDTIDGTLAYAKPTSTGGGGSKGGGRNKTTTTDTTTDTGTTDTGTSTDTGTGSTTTTTDTATDGYDIDVVFSGTGWTDSLKAAFTAAETFLESIITSDLPDFLGIDDLRITASLADLPSGILGQAGPTTLRWGSYLPAEGSMTFDIDAAAAYDAKGQFDDIVLHEMMHCVGFGSLWSMLGLVSGPTDDLRFTGAKAIEVYNSGQFADIAANDPLSAYGVPVESTGGSGTAGSHWDEATFGAEEMTGYLNGTPYVSDLTLASLEDMGYQVNYDALLVA
ncbi:leishmanolysin-related zinc metalloendopeptidase [Mangrovicoccus sp. HB161399]|uniref:leishmanolysin-related zinc metalloendopeptidase n=1 Tax=Mangrovicoccus sp. HB161399 TaxID=2720392 RepID=UPI0015518C3D|nr:leishmanolysin-related zinc metalloendopeptidase [Mangrovicoccus sp. HB161399]